MQPKWHIPLTVDGRRVWLTSESTASKYNIPVLDVGDQVDYGPSDHVPSFGRTAADAVLLGYEAANDWRLGIVDDGTREEQETARAHYKAGITAYLAQWPEGPQLADASLQTAVYAADSLPNHWIVGVGTRLWLIPVRPDGWQAREPYRGHRAALQPAFAGVAAGARKTCGIPPCVSREGARP